MNYGRGGMQMGAQNERNYHASRGSHGSHGSHDVTVRYSQSNGIEMNGYSRRGKSQSPEVTSWVQVRVVQ